MNAVLALLAAPAWAQEAPGPAEFIGPALTEQPPLPWPGGPPYTPVEIELLLLLDEQGLVQQASVLRGEEPFSRVALEAAWDLRFEPAREGGEPVAVELPFTWTFTPPPVQLRVLLLDEQGMPLAGRALQVGDQALRTDAAGAAEARELPEGPLTLTVDDPRFGPTPVVLEPGQVVELLLRAPPPAAPEGEALGVYRRLQPQVERRTVTAEQIRTTPGTLGDPVRVIQNLPGVVRTPFDSGWLIIRGGDPEDAGMYIDGVQVPLVYHVGGFTSVLHPGFIEEVQYTPGTWSPRYGRATSGVVDIQTQPASRPAQVLFGADLIHAGVFARTPIGAQQGVAAAVRRSYLDQVLTLALGEEQAAIAPRFWDGQLRWDSPRAGLFLLGFSDTIDAPTGVGDETAQINIRTARAHGRVSLAPGPTTLTFTPVLAVEQRRVAYEELSDARTSAGGGLRVEWAGGADPARLAWQLGVDAERYAYTLTVNELALEAPWSSADPYAQLRLGSGAGGPAVDLGLRLDTLVLGEQPLRWGLSPKARLQVPLHEALLLVADLGQSHRYPPLEWALGLPGGVSLQLERARAAGLGLHATGQRFGAELDAWGRRADHITTFEDDGTLAQGQGLAYGVEALARGALGDWSGWVSYTWSRSLRRDQPGDAFAPHIYDQPHYLVTVLAWSLPRDWSLSGRFRLGSGYAWNRDDTEALDILALELVPMQADLNGRLQPYVALDLKLAKQATWRNTHLELYLDVQNATNRRIAEPMITGIEDRDTVYGFGLPILPIFGLQGGWVKGG